jgi:CheY-like chemotaxis protein
MAERNSEAPVRRVQRWARLRAANHQHYPVTFQHQWLRVVEQPDPDVPVGPRHLWLDCGGRAQQVDAGHFEIVERSKPRLLVVDDDPSIRQTLKVALNKAGFDVRAAPDGDQAGSLWREWGPDLIISDIHMPRKSGLLLMEELQANHASTRVIAMTDGGPQRNLGLMGVSSLLGAARTIAKPFTMDQMVQLVRDELSR